MTLRALTQSNLDPGNCWQTAYACLLDVPAEHLPDQVTIEVAGHSYNNALLAYLEIHHGMTFGRVEAHLFPSVRPVGGHLLVGPTVRTTPEHPIHHVVVGADGEMVWDPHPSRAGLVAVHRWEVLVPIPEAMRAERARMRERGVIKGCLCPECAP